MRRRLKVAAVFLSPFVGAFCWVFSFALFLEYPDNWGVPLAFIFGAFLLFVGACLGIAWGQIIDEWPTRNDADVLDRALRDTETP